MCLFHKALVWRALLSGHWPVPLDAGASKAKQRRRKGKDPLRARENFKPSVAWSTVMKSSYVHASGFFV
jgi:hypothetical protein